MKSTLISVIIPTYHRNDTLAKCLDLIAPGVQTLAAEHYEVIVTDDGYKTTAQQMISERYPWVKWIPGPRRGPANNRNNGAKYAVGKWLVFTDDDCLPYPNWLQAYAEAMNGSSLALEGSIYPIGDFSQDMIEAPENKTGGYFWSANIAIVRSLFEKLGGFDSNYLITAEDVDLQCRVKELTTISFVPEARLDHPLRVMTMKEAIKRIPPRAVAIAYHINKHRHLYRSQSPIGLTVFQAKYYLKWSLDELIDQKPKTAFICLTTLVIGVPIIFVNLLWIRWKNLKTDKNKSQLTVQ